MLSVTYSLAVLSAEQDKTSNMFDMLEHCVRTMVRKTQGDVDVTDLEAAFRALLQFDEYCHERRLEIHLMPALRIATGGAETVLSEHDYLNARIASMLSLLRTRLDLAGIHPPQRRLATGSAIETCFQLVKERLEMEEQQIFSIARSLLPPDDWFVIATKFLSIDERRSGRLDQPQSGSRDSAGQASAA